MASKPVVCDPSFIIFPTEYPIHKDLNIESWANDAVTELINDYWSEETKLEKDVLKRVLREIEISFPEFCKSKTPEVIKKKPTLNGLMATSKFILYPAKVIDIDKLVAHSKYFHHCKRKGSTEYRREEMLSLYINYTKDGSIGIFGPKTFAELHTVLAAFLTDLAQVATTCLKQTSISLHPLQVSNTVITNRQNTVTFDIDLICKRLIAMNLRHTVFNSSITVCPFPESADKCHLKIFESGSISCLGTASRSVKSLAYHFIDQLISNSKAFVKQTAAEETPLLPKKQKNKAKHEAHMRDLLQKKKETYREYEEDLPE